MFLFKLHYQVFNWVWGFFSKKMIFRIGVLPKNCVMKTKPPGRVKQQRIKRKTF